MDRRELFTEINGKKVGCIFIFDKYKEKQCNKDFEDFAAYQTKKNLKGGLDSRFYFRIKKFKPIPFGYFKEKIVYYFSRIIFGLLKEHPEYIISDRLNIHIKLLRIAGRKYYFEYDDKASDPENACYYGAGFWFIQTIAAPLFYLGRIDFSIITRFFLHELGHHIDYQNKNIIVFDKIYEKFGRTYEDKIASLVKNKFARHYLAYSLNYLYSSLFDLRQEGLQDFRARADSPKIDINMKGVKEYNKNLEKLAKITIKKEAEEFYEEKIEVGNLTPSGGYANGRMMCLFIALAVAKERKSPYYLLVGKDKLYGYEFKELNKFLFENKILYVSGLSKETLQETIRRILYYPHYFFVKLYEDACDNLGISESDRIMTRAS